MNIYSMIDDFKEDDLLPSKKISNNITLFEDL